MNYSKIKHYDIANGEGVRISLFVSGCKFHCKDCFNSEAWDFNYGTPFTSDTFVEIIEQATSDRYAGLSILGGDPLWQTKDDMAVLALLAQNVRSQGKTVWIWSGFVWEDIMEHVEECSPQKDEMSIEEMMKYLISQCDVWVDGLFEADKKDLRLKWRGSSNQRVIDVQKSLKEGKVVLWET